MANVTRFRSSRLMPLAMSAVASAFVSGCFVGALASAPPIAVPAIVEPCGAAVDPIACLIEEADEEESEPPQ